LATRTLTIAMNGVTGRMGRNQHLARSILAIRQQGGVALAGGDVVWPEPILVGRDESRLAALAKETGVDNHTTDLASVLDDPSVDVYFDTTATASRSVGVRAAIEAGKAVYCEKPLAEDADTALELYQLARDAGIKHGIVQDKLFLPGLRKLRRLLDSGFFGRVLSVRGDFGYWVFEGDTEPPQRPSWNYRRDQGGSIIVDMYGHWQYVIENLFGRITSVMTVGTTDIPERVDERGETYTATADDAAYGLFELDTGAIVQINSSWATRVYRDELLVFQVDGTHGSAIAGLRGCRQQHRSATPRPVWNPDVDNPIDFRAGWLEVPDAEVYENGFKVQWEQFLRHVATGAPFAWDFAAGARGSQLIDLAMSSWRDRCWVDVPELAV
jgi:predicted dehydrogenase